MLNMAWAHLLLSKPCSALFGVFSLLAVFCVCVSVFGCVLCICCSFLYLVFVLCICSAFLCLVVFCVFVARFSICSMFSKCCACVVKLMKMFSSFACVLSICMCYLKLLRVELSGPPYLRPSKAK